MDTSYFATLFDYDRWATNRILKAAEGVPEDEFTKARAYPHGGLRTTFIHALGAGWVWRSRCQFGRSLSTFITVAEFPTLDAIAQRWQEEQRGWLEFVGTLNDTDLDRVVEYRTTTGEPQSETLKLLLSHVVNHGTQHRSEAAAMLTDLGCSPGDVDLIVYLRAR
jgi:uncharacterized damage-inducible protein DinB